MEALINLPQFYSGKFMERYFATELIGQSVKIQCKDGVEAELDGEILEGLVEKVEIVPQALQLLRT